MCIETRRAKAAMGAMPNKTDRNDARGLAQIIRTGWYRAVHVKTPTCRSWRALLAARRLVLNKMRDLENGLRAVLREAGLKLGTPTRKEFAALQLPTSLTSRRGRYSCGFDLCLSPTRSLDVESLQTAQHRGTRP